MRTRRAALVLAALVSVAITSSSAPAAADVQTIVTIQFDDGTADAHRALPILQTRGMRATFYVNTGLIGDSAHLSWEQLAALRDAGNEIAGHTLTHVSLRRLAPADARRQVCDDRAALLARGFQATSFAYPFGAFDEDARRVVRDCGYNSARGVSGVDGRRTFAETVPPRDAYATRVPPLPKRSTSLATIESYVTDAEQHGGGWVQLVFHRLCDGCGTYSISEATFAALLDWLQPRAAHGTVVRTTHEVIGGAVQPVPTAP